jgi:hypothetical protein
MLEIVVNLDQYILVPELRRVFPDLCLAKRIDGRKYYLASLADGPKGMHQRAFLSECNLEYIDHERQREQSIRAFFAGVELEGKPIDQIIFRRILNQGNYHSAALHTEDDEIYLRFPPHWNPGQWTRRDIVVGWLYVYKASEQICAALVGTERCITEPIKRTSLTTEMAMWLQEQGYMQVVCITTRPDIFGLYQPPES